MKLFLLISLLIFPMCAMAQDEDIDPYRECAEVLSSPPAYALAEMSDDGTYGKFDDLIRPHILGKTCSADQITKYMLDAGWELGGKGITTYEIQHESAHGTYQYSYNSKISFCLPERGFWRLLNHCGGGAGFFLLGEKISWLVFVVPIRFGG